MIQVTVNDGHTHSLKMAQDVENENIRNGHHPFPMLEQFNIHNAGKESLYSYPFLDASVKTSYKRVDYQAVQLDILNHAQPWWDMAESHLSGRFFIRLNLIHSLSSFEYSIWLSLHLMDQDDVDRLQVLMRLEGLSEPVVLKYHY